MPAKLSAQCAFGMFIAILMTGIFPEARAEPVVIEIGPAAGSVLLKPPASPGGRIEIAQVGSGEPRGDTVGRRDRPGVVVTTITNRPGETIKITTGSAQLLPLEKRAKTVIVGDHNLIDVVVENDRLAVLTAKDKPGLTNIIVLDEDGREVFAAPVIVVPPARGRTIVYVSTIKRAWPTTRRTSAGRAGGPAATESKMKRPTSTGSSPNHAGIIKILTIRGAWVGAARRRHLPPAPSRFFVLFVSQLPHAKAFGEDHEMPTRAANRRSSGSGARSGRCNRSFPPWRE